MSLQILVEGEPLDLLEGAENDFFVNKQIHDLSNLQTRNTSSSKVIKIPVTAKNLKLIGTQTPTLNRFSETPTNYVFCEVELHGVPIMEDSYLVVAGQTRDLLEVGVFGNNSIFFSNVQDVPLSILDLSDLDFTWTLAGVAGISQNTTGVVFCDYIPYSNASRGKYDRNGNSDDTQTRLDKLELGESGFYIYLHTLVQRIFDAIPEAVLDVSRMDSLYFQSALHINNPILHNAFLAEPGAFGHVQTVGPGALIVNAETRMNYATVIADNGIDFDLVDNEYDILTTANYSVNASMRGNANITFLAIRIYVDRGFGGGTELISASSIIPNTGNRPYTISTEGNIFLNAQDVVYVTYEATGTSIELDQTDFYCQTQGNGDSVNVDVASLMPDYTQKEFIKDVFKLFSIVPIEKGTRVELHYFEEIATNTPQTLKIDNFRSKEVLREFSTYYQNNLTVYTPNDLIISDDYQSGFNTNSQVLTYIGTIIQVQFNGNDGTITPGPARLSHPQYELFYEYHSDNDMDGNVGGTANQFTTQFDNTIQVGDFISLEGQRRRVTAVINGTTGTVDVDFVGNPGPSNWHHWRYNANENNGLKQIAYIDQTPVEQTFWNGGLESTFSAFTSSFPSTLKWDSLLKNYYPTITGALFKPFIIQGWVVMGTVEFSGLDLLTPYYIEELNSYFYINKIEQFKNGLGRFEFVELKTR
jgi:hypothetical protein